MLERSSMHIKYILCRQWCQVYTQQAEGQRSAVRGFEKRNVKKISFIYKVSPKPCGFIEVYEISFVV